MRSSETIRNKARLAGFSMIELLIAIAIIGVLAGLLLVVLSGARGAARSASDSQLLSNIKVGIGLFEDDHGFIPPLVKDNSNAKYDSVSDPGAWSNTIFSNNGTDRPVYNNAGRLRVNVFDFGGRGSEAEFDTDYLRGDGIALALSRAGTSCRVDQVVGADGLGDVAGAAGVLEVEQHVVHPSTGGHDVESAPPEGLEHDVAEVAGGTCEHHSHRQEGT